MSGLGFWVERVEGGLGFWVEQAEGLELKFWGVGVGDLQIATVFRVH